jgi:hypothetical protein
MGVMEMALKATDQARRMCGHREINSATKIMPVTVSATNGASILH